MNSQIFDVIVLGLGAMGSSAVWRLSQTSARVLGIDQFVPPHGNGSSHGLTRIIREAYFEHPVYVPLVQRAYQLWSELEQQSGKRLFQPTGGLMLGAPGTIVFEGAKRSAIEHHLPHEILTSDEVHRRFPGLKPGPEMMAVLEPRAGFLYPEECIRSSLALAVEGGAALRLEEKVESWSAAPGRVTVRTSKGTYEAGKLIISAGAWLAQLMPELTPILRVERQILFWFSPPKPTPNYDLGRCPVHLWEHGPGLQFYGFPDVGQGVKLARHHSGETTAPDTVNRQVGTDDADAMRQIVAQYLPEANGPILQSTVCFYTNTPDGHFLIDQHPAHSNVLIASPCSGHGFKFASAIGEVLSELATKGESPFSADLFRMGRLRI